MRERLCGLDLYRSLAILMITALHVNWQHCGLIYTPGLPRSVYGLGLFIEYLCFAGVNCFAMLSGYLSGTANMDYGRSWIGRIASFWLKMTLWSVILYLAVVFCLPGGGNYRLDFRSTFFPFAGPYWYINAYFVLMVVMPVLNRGLAECSDKSLLVLSAALFVFTSVLPSFGLESAELSLAGGYSAVWLVVCYIYGCAIRRLAHYVLGVRNIKLILVSLLALSVGVPFICDFAGGKWMLFYHSPFCVVEAASLMLLLLQVKIKSGSLVKAVSFVSVNSLGVYLVQTHPFIWNNYVVRTNPELYPCIKMAGYFIAVVLILEIAGLAFNFVVDRCCRLIVSPILMARHKT